MVIFHSYVSLPEGTSNSLKMSLSSPSFWAKNITSRARTWLQVLPFAAHIDRDGHVVKLRRHLEIGEESTEEVSIHKTRKCKNDPIIHRNLKNLESLMLGPRDLLRQTHIGSYSQHI